MLPWFLSGWLDMAGAEIPAWLQIILGAGGFGLTVATAVISGKKSAGSVTESQATVLAGSITDSKQVSRIIDAVDAVKDEMREGREQRHRDSVAEREAVESNTRAIRENTDAMRSSGYDPKMLALMLKLRDK